MFNNIVYLSCIYFAFITDGWKLPNPIHKTELQMQFKKHYPYSNEYFQQYIKRLNSKNITIQHESILGQDDKISFLNYKKNIIEENSEIFGNQSHPDSKKSKKTPWNHFRKKKESKDFETQLSELKKEFEREEKRDKNRQPPTIINILDLDLDENQDEEGYDEYEDEHSELNNDSPEEKAPIYNIPEVFIISRSDSSTPHTRYQNKFSFQEPNYNSKKKIKSEHFEILEKSPITFADIGGYDSIKKELSQCIDILKNFEKYKDFNVRTPKGLILEGPPGNGKTLLAKGLAGEANSSFIAVSGSEFQEKYVGVGASRVRELFDLAKDNIPCIIFLDEIDAIGRKRSTDSDSANSERDSTLNQLLVNMDGFLNCQGIFIIGATNRADLLDPALIRPGRIDKRVYISLPDSSTREAILRIHINGKPHDSSINVHDLVEITNGLSGAQLENLLNEAMLYAIRDNRTQFTQNDVENVMNRIIAGWQPSEHQFTNNMLEQIAIHEMGHAIVGLLSKHHSKMTKVVLNLFSPQSPGYTIFETTASGLYTREALFEHLMILLAGRIAEEVFYNVSVTTGAINDFEEALKLAEKMIVYYGMGRNLIYPSLSEKYKEIIDNEVITLIQDAYRISHFIVKNCKDVIGECAEILQKDKIIRADQLLEIVNTKYPNILNLF